MVTVKLMNGEIRTHEGRQGQTQWVVEDNGVLHVRDVNHRVLASYAHGVWAEVK